MSPVIERSQALRSSTKMLKLSSTPRFKYLAIIYFARKTNSLVVVDLLAGSCICTGNKLIKAKAICPLTFFFLKFFSDNKLTSEAATGAVLQKKAFPKSFWNMHRKYVLQ